VHRLGFVHAARDVLGLQRAVAVDRAGADEIDEVSPGDAIVELGVPGVTIQSWSQRHAEFEKLLWHSNIPYPKHHWMCRCCPRSMIFCSSATQSFSGHLS
jgi:hypothetical protein